MRMSRNIYNFEMTAGETRTLAMIARDNAGAIINLSGATIEWNMARTPSGGSQLTKSGSIVSAADGSFSVALVAAETDSFSGDYWHQAKVTIAGAVNIAAQGKIRFNNLIGQACVDWDLWT